jgi:hypothetical protein
MPSRSSDDALTVPYVYESWFSPEIDELVLTLRWLRVGEDTRSPSGGCRSSPNTKTNIPIWRTSSIECSIGTPNAWDDKLPVFEPDAKGMAGRDSSAKYSMYWRKMYLG